MYGIAYARHTLNDPHQGPGLWKAPSRKKKSHCRKLELPPSLVQHQVAFRTRLMIHVKLCSTISMDSSTMQLTFSLSATPYQNFGKMLRKNSCHSQSLTVTGCALPRSLAYLWFIIRQRQSWQNLLVTRRQ